jgi:hypothetical protein
MNNQETEFRAHILNEIRRIAADKGKTPGQNMFARETQIVEHQWRGKFWARWGDALTEAGYGPNKWTQRLKTDEVLLQIVAACRYYGKVPTQSEMDLYRQNNPTLPSNQAIKNHFSGRPGLFKALLKLADSDNQYADIRAMLPAEISADPQKPLIVNKTTEGFVYLIKSGDHYKIGQTENIERRFKEIGISLPDKATIIHTIRTDDPPGIEAYWHNRFKEKRANGEWFKLSSIDISAFRKRKFQ